MIKKTMHVCEDLFILVRPRKICSMLNVDSYTTAVAR